jgi:molybdopterin-guanine dinucleotide biosynthesis protein B
MALVTEYADRGEPDFPDVIDMLGPCDLIVVEGYKTAPILKVEARRGAALTKQPLAATDPHVIAIAADHAVTDSGALPVFALDDIEGIADLVVERLALRRP